jgi:hypothetical protein
MNEFLIKHNIKILFVRTSYLLNVNVDFKKVKSKCSKKKIIYSDFKNSIMLKIDYNNNIYDVDIYNNGRLVIWEITDSKLMLKLITKIIRKLDLRNNNRLIAENLNITNIHCESPINYNIDIDIKQLMTKSFSLGETNTLYYKFDRNRRGNLLIFPKEKINIYGSSILDIICIYTRVYVCITLPRILKLLKENKSSLFYFLPSELISKILLLAQK